MAIDINEFIKLFAFAPANFIEESFKEVRIRFTANELVQISNEIGQTDSISFLNDRDLLKISVFVGDDDPIDYYSPGSTVNFFREVFNRLEIREDDEKIEIHFDIIKKTVYGILSIYFPDKFIEYVSDLELTEVLHGLHNEFQQEQKLILQPLTGKLTFRTATIASDINKVDSRLMSYEMRESRVASLNSIGNFNLTNSFKFIPDDFHILECSNQQLKILFNKICAIYSTAYLFDIIAVSKSIIDYKLNGYKTIIGQLDFRILRERHLAEYFRIYDWTFKGGNLNDKVGLARNIISLHLDNSKGIEIIGNPFQSIQSSYKVYEKQNIKQYIEIRNKISDQLLTFHDRANKIVESFASGFQKSALALISFYISAIIIKLIGKPVFKDIFTIDSTILSSVFICFSYIYYRIALWEVKEQRKRFIGSYKNMKQRYLDLLDVEDIKRILNDDKEYYADLSFLDDKQQKYANLWKYYLLGLFIVTTSLFLYYHH